MTKNVSQQRATDQPFTVADLHQFVDQANREGLPDETRVTCTVYDRHGSVFSLSTFSASHDGEGVSQVTPTPSGIADPDSRTTIEQDSTGPIVSYRRWFRTHVVSDLVLGDVRALLARIYEAGLPIDMYEIAALTANGSRQRVHRISARPRATKATPQPEPDRD